MLSDPGGNNALVAADGAGSVSPEMADVKAEMADVKAKIADVKAEIADVKAKADAVEAKIKLYESAFSRKKALERKAERTDEEEDTLGNLNRFLALEPTVQAEQLARLEDQLAKLEDQRAKLLHRENLFLEKEVRSGAGGVSYMAFEVKFSTNEDVRAFPFRGMLKLELKAEKLYPRGTVTRNERHYKVNFIVVEANLSRVFEVVKSTLERVQEDLNDTVKKIFENITYSSSSFDEWKNCEAWADTYEPSPGSPMRSDAPTLVGDPLEFDAKAILSEEDFRRIAAKHGNKKEEDFNCVKKSRTSSSDSASSASTRPRLFRKFNAEGPLAEQVMVAAGGAPMENAHVTFAVKHYSAIIAILEAVTLQLKLPGVDEGMKVAAEKAWWDLCATGPRMELDMITHRVFDNLYFYWAWNVLDEDDKPCTIHLARRDIAGKVIERSVWQTWCVRVPGGQTDLKMKFIHAFALRKHLTLALSGARKVLDVPTFVQDWTAVQSTCWNLGADPDLADHNPLATAGGSE